MLLRCNYFHFLSMTLNYNCIRFWFLFLRFVVRRNWIPLTKVRDSLAEKWKLNSINKRHVCRKSFVSSHLKTFRFHFTPSTAHGSLLLMKILFSKTARSTQKISGKCVVSFIFASICERSTSCLQFLLGGRCESAEQTTEVLLSPISMWLPSEDGFTGEDDSRGF